MADLRTCFHGVKWVVRCIDCEIVSAEEKLRFAEKSASRATETLKRLRAEQTKEFRAALDAETKREVKS